MYMCQSSISRHNADERISYTSTDTRGNTSSAACKVKPFMNPKFDAPRTADVLGRSYGGFHRARSTPILQSKQAEPPNGQKSHTQLSLFVSHFYVKTVIFLSKSKQTKTTHSTFTFLYTLLRQNNDIPYEINADGQKSHNQLSLLV